MHAPELGSCAVRRSDPEGTASLLAERSEASQSMVAQRLDVASRFTEVAP